MLTETRIGRGKLHFTAPLLLTGGVNTAAYGARWGNNWGADFGAATPAPGDLRMAPGRFVGNARGLVLQTQITEVDVPDFTGLGDGGDRHIVEGVKGFVSLYGFGARNLADVLCSTLASVAGGSATEVIAAGNANVEAGAMLFTAHAIDNTAAAAVTPSWATWTENVHWTREPFGFRLLHGFAGPAGGTITLAYRKEGGAHEVEALSRSEIELGMVYTGINTVGGKADRADAYRCVIKPAETLELITEGAGELPLNFTLRPVRPPGSTKLRWFRTMKGETANG